MTSWGSISWFSSICYSDKRHNITQTNAFFNMILSLCNRLIIIHNISFGQLLPLFYPSSVYSSETTSFLRGEKNVEGRTFFFHYLPLTQQNLSSIIPVICHYGRMKGVPEVGVLILWQIITAAHMLTKTEKENLNFCYFSHDLTLHALWNEFDMPAFYETVQLLKVS